MKTGQTIVSRQLPKTGQTAIMTAGDDGTYQAGWWKGLTVANNKTRFIAKTIDGNDIVIDRATGLMWAADSNEAGCNNGATIVWVDAITYMEALTFATFSDWRLPNYFELISIINTILDRPCVEEPPFSNTFSDKYWTSSWISGTNQRRVIDFSYGFVSAESGTGETFYLRGVRGGL